MESVWWSGSYLALVAYSPPKAGFNLFLSFLEPPNRVYSGISCTGYSLVSYDSEQVIDILNGAFREATSKPIGYVRYRGNSPPAYLPLNYNILKKCLGSS